MIRALEVLSLSKTIGDSIILDNINIEVDQNCICGIIGRNASGKSMFFKAILGLSPINCGTIKIFGKPITSPSTLEQVGALIEHPGFLPQFTAKINLELICKIRGNGSLSIAKRLMKQIGLDYEDNRPVKKYSLGMKQKLGIVSSLITEPQLIILDEPTNNLDIESVLLVRKIISEEKNRGATILISSHNEKDIELLCDEVYEMTSGRLSKVLPGK